MDIIPFNLKIPTIDVTEDNKKNYFFNIFNDFIVESSVLVHKVLTGSTSGFNLFVQSEKAANVLGRSLRTGVGDCTINGGSLFLCLSKIINKEAILIKSFMVGVAGSIRACWNLFPVDQPNTPTALSLVASGGSLNTTEQELVMLQHNYTQKPNKTNPLNISVSTTKQNSLKKQHEIIGYALDIFCTEHNENNRATLKSDVLELARMLDDLSNDLSRTSRFNVLDKSKQVVAENITFDQTKQYKNCIVEFSGMEA